MKKQRNFIIIDKRTEQALYGYDQKTLTFSTREIAQQVAEQFFENLSDTIILDRSTLNF